MPVACILVLPACSAMHAPTWPSLDSILILGLGHCSEVTPRRLQAAGGQCGVGAHLGLKQSAQQSTKLFTPTSTLHFPGVSAPDFQVVIVCAIDEHGAPRGGRLVDRRGGQGAVPAERSQHLPGGCDSSLCVQHTSDSNHTQQQAMQHPEPPTITHSSSTKRLLLSAGSATIVP